MSILNVDKIQPIGGGSTITVDATDIQASTGTITANSYTGVDNTLKVSIGGTEYVRTHSTGQVSIGSTFMWRSDTVAQVYGKSPDLSLSRFNDQFMIAGNETSGAINTGAGIQFFGHDGVQQRGMAYIRGLKENGTSGDRASYLAFATRANGGTLEERLRITSAGLVQIGLSGMTGGDDQALVVNNPSGDVKVLELSTSNATGRINCSRTLSNTLNTTSYIEWSEPGAQGTGDLRFGTSSGGNNPTERLRITSAGNLQTSGITTSNTGFMFGTDGQHYLYQSASDTATLRITSDGPYVQFKDAGGDVQMGSASGTLRLSAGGVEKLRVNTQGNFTFYNSAAAWNTIQRANTGHYIGIRIQETDGTQRMQFGVAGGANQIVTGAAQHDVCLKAYDANLILAANATERLRITSAGAIQCKGETDVQNSIFRVTDATPRIIMSVPSGGLDTRLFNDGSGNFIIGHGTNSDTPTERLRITPQGYREIRNYHYGPWAFINDTWKTTITVGDPGDHKHTTIKFILTLIDGAYRQGFWQGEFVIWSSNAVGGPGVSHIYKKIWDNVGSTNWSGGTVSYQMSGGAFQFKADNGHDDAAGNAYIHILDVIGDIDGSTVASISS